MRVQTAAILLVLTGFEPAHAQPDAAIADQRGGAFYTCTTGMALWTLRRKGGQIDKRSVVDEVVSDCLLQMPNDVLLGTERDRDAWMAQAKRNVAAQVEKLAPRARAEKADEDQVTANYFSCLERRAKVLALATDEPADIVAQASLSACPAERADVFEVHRRYGDGWEEGTMKAMESALVQQLLLEIVKARAQRNITPPLLEPKPQKTPI
jgi:hypothetical protein